MQKPQLAAALVLALAAGAAGCDDDDETGPSTPRFAAALAAGSEVNPDPPITSGATGTATFTQNGATINYTVAVAGLSSNPIGAHIHGPADEQTNAGVIVPLTVTATQTSGTIAAGSFTAAQISQTSGVSFDSLLVLMRNGNSYVNVHTQNHQAGEVRGQVERLP